MFTYKKLVKLCLRDANFCEFWSENTGIFTGIFSNCIPLQYRVNFEIQNLKIQYRTVQSKIPVLYVYGTVLHSACYPLSFGRKFPTKSPRIVTRIQGNYIDTYFCSKCRNAYYRAIKIYIKKIVEITLWRKSWNRWKKSLLVLWLFWKRFRIPKDTHWQ